MNYELPDFFLNELNYGIISTNIDNAISTVDIKGLYALKNMTIDEFKTYIKGYISYTFLTAETDAQQLVILKLLKTTKNNLYISQLILEFVCCYTLSIISDAEIMESVNTAKKEYIRVQKYCYVPDYKILSMRFDPQFYEMAKNEIENNHVDAPLGQLLPLMKCLIIDTRYNPESDLNQGGYANMQDVIMEAGRVFNNFSISYEDKRAQVEACKEKIEEVETIIDYNNFIR